MKQTSKDKINEVTRYLNLDYSLGKIAKIVGISKSSVFRIKKEHNILTNCSLGGRPAKLNDKNKRQILRSITSGKTSNAVEASKDLNKSLNIDVNPQTIRRVLKKAGLRSIVKKKKPRLSKKHKRERMLWAEKYKNWTLADWHRVIWSDETKINRLGSDGKKWAWKTPNSSLQDHHIIQTTKYGGGSLMLWGCMTSKGVGDYIRIDVRMNSDAYCTILNEGLLGTIKYFRLNSNYIVFQQDNDPKHTSIKARNWLEKIK